MRVVVEGAGDQDVEACIACFACRCHKVRTRHGTEFGADKHARASLPAVLAFQVAPFGANILAGPACQRRKRDAIFLVRLLHARRTKIFQNRSDKRLLVAISLLRFTNELAVSLQLIILIHDQHSMRRQRLNRKRSSDANGVFILVGLVVQKF